MGKSSQQRCAIPSAKWPSAFCETRWTKSDNCGADGASRNSSTLAMRTGFPYFVRKTNAMPMSKHEPRLDGSYHTCTSSDEHIASRLSRQMRMPMGSPSCFVLRFGQWTRCPFASSVATYPAMRSFSASPACRTGHIKKIFNEVSYSNSAYQYRFPTVLLQRTNALRHGVSRVRFWYV